MVLVPRNNNDFLTRRNFRTRFASQVVEKTRVAVGKSVYFAIVTVAAIAFCGCAARRNTCPPVGIKNTVPKPVAQQTYYSLPQADSRASYMACCSDGMCLAQGHHKVKVFIYHYEAPKSTLGDAVIGTDAHGR